MRNRKPKPIPALSGIRALTVQQPWAWAIVSAGKTIENRTQMWSYRPTADPRGCTLVGAR